MSSELSRHRFGAAVAFLERHARPLDLALWRLGRGEGTSEAVLEALAPFQNADGGFGHGLEPDTTAAASTGIATSVGLRFLLAADADGGHPMVQRIVAWLDGAVDRERGVWPIIGAEVEQAPHAPWWSWSEDLAGAWNGFRFNPTAEILGGLYVYRDATPAPLLASAEAGLRRSLAESRFIEGAYDLKCAIRLAETRAAPPDLTAPLADAVRRSVTAHDPADEHASALEFAPRPGSLCADIVADRLEAAIARLLDAQQPDGGWTPFWDWSFVDESAWEKAKRDWRGWLTREALETLSAWGRVATA